MKPKIKRLIAQVSFLNTKHLKIQLVRRGLTFLIAALSLGSAQLTNAQSQGDAPIEESAEVVTAEGEEGNGADGSPIAALPALSVVGSKENAALIPSSASFLDLDDLRIHQVTDVNRALRKAPGVYVREEDGYGLFPNVSLRGVDPGRSGKITIMEDGILTAPAPYSSPSAYYFPTVGRMSGIEALKGSSQVKYGPQITGGALNFISTPIPDSRQTYFRAYYGSYNEFLAHAYFGGTEFHEKSGNWGYLVEGFLHQSDGFKEIQSAAGYPGSDQTGFRRVEPMVKVFWEPNFNKYHRLEFKYGYSDFLADETYLGLNDSDFDADPFQRYAATRFDQIESYNHRTSLRHTVELSDAVTVTSTAYYQFFHRDWFKLNALKTPNLSLSEALINPVGLAVLRGQSDGVFSVRHNNRDYELRGVQSIAQYAFETGAVSHQSELGLRLHVDEEDRFQWEEDFQQQNGAIVGSTETARGSAGDRIQQSAAISIFAQDEMKYEKWTIKPGLRFETIGQRYEQDYRRVDGGGTPTLEEDDLQVAAGGLSLGYTVAQGWNLFTSAYRGYALPGPRDAIRNNLKEESSINFEAGVKYRQDPKALGFELIYFYSDFSDLIVGDSIGASGGVAGADNVGDIKVHGVELAAQYDPGLANDWIFKTPLSLSFTYTHARLNGAANSADPESIFAGGQDGAEVPYIPEYQVNAEAGLEWGRAGLYLTGTYVPATFTSASNTGLQIAPDGTPDARFGETDPYFLLDLSTRYQINEHWRAFGGVRNLLDRQYIASRQPHGPRPGLPLTLQLGVEAWF